VKDTLDRPSYILRSGTGDGPVDRLTTLCEGADSLSMAVGFLFLEGLSPLLPIFQSVRRARLLVGNVVNRLTEEQIHEARTDRVREHDAGHDYTFAKGLKEERDRAALETALNLRRTIEAMPRTKSNGTIILNLATLIAKGSLQVRLLSTRRLHAKVAIMSYPGWHERAPGVAIVGSTNVTFAANPAISTTSATWSADLDVQVDGKESLDSLNGWFDAHWVEAQDFQKELFEELGRSWPLQTTVSK
jgi:hypothetical protein